MMKRRMTETIELSNTVECKHCELCDLITNRCLLDQSKCYENKKCLHEDCKKFKEGNFCTQ